MRIDIHINNLNLKKFFGGNPFRCVAVRKFTGKGVMRADEGTRFTYQGKKIYHFMVRSCSHPGSSTG